MIVRIVRTIFLITLGVSFCTQKGIGENAQKSIAEPRPRDVWGHTYKRQTNLFRDRDGNGVINLYQKRDRQPKMIRGKIGRKGKQRR